MTEDKKLSVADLEERLLYDDDDDAASGIDVRQLLTILILHWRWFVLSVVLCLAGAFAYLRYTTAIYSLSARMLIKDDKQNSRSNADVLANMRDLGFMSNLAGIENEMQILQSRVLVRDAVNDLKLYTEYYRSGTLRNNLVYGNQPWLVDIDAVALDSMDRVLHDETRTIRLQLASRYNTVQVEGQLLCNGQPVQSFNFTPRQLPASVRTAYGTLTFRVNPACRKTDDGDYIVTIQPPMLVAKTYLGKLDVKPVTKQSSIAEITLQDAHVHRGLDFLSALTACYNRQANADKNEIALKTEEFINARINKINAELGYTEGTLERYKKRNTVTRLEMDATQSLQMSGQYSTKLAEATSEIQLLDYLREFVDNPANQDKIIPSNVGMTDQASTALIASYNQTVQDRNRLLKVASEQAPQVMALTATLDELQSSIRAALLQARRSADIQQQGICDQYAKYQGRLGSTPEQEVRSGLYLMLLQKREENSISLAATADKGKLIDEPQLVGKVKPRGAIIMLGALVVGLAVPMGVILLIRYFEYRLARLFNIYNDRSLGVSNLLAMSHVSPGSVRAQIVSSGIDSRLDLLMAGPVPPNPTELLARQNMADVIDVLRKDYDYIIIDTVPVGFVTDTLQIARYAHVNCYVCRADYTHKNDIKIVNTLAAEQKLPKPCMVLNGIDMSKRKHGYYYGYGFYGRYGRYAYSHYGNNNDKSIKR
ncbi:exopolysaccharide transport family protein [Xylanibacter ruminicola]|uniref:exopolysaccharide transport family protein n=1 Tax=Xylanibacter ruminicola TaxID=839 RepID=UPI00048EAA95|nr:Wzz/FepE/Etk N-terminal domain-containing protein [Xylanibacter ruminicola]